MKSGNAHICCTAPIILQDVDLMQETCIEDTQLLLDSTDALKHKVVFIAGFLHINTENLEKEKKS